MIAAGEVVERPSSVVKELVENSLDAGASTVVIEISEGGTKLIKVSDDGFGMSKEDLAICTLPHTTSKLFTAEDLSSISTFGFRGEALSSINAVSKLKITTASNSNAYEYSNGEISESSRNQGTTVEIKDLFYNTPARLKFLKAHKTEERYVEETVSHLILANPDVSFTLVADGKTVITSSGKGATNALYSVFKNNASKFLELNFSKDNFKLSGFISSPQLTRPSRSGQVIIINGRVVTDSKITVAVEKAYGTALMKHCFPLYVLSALMPFDSVDVNVHPQKSEVRFENPDKVFSLFYAGVTQTLRNNTDIFTLDSLSKSENRSGNLYGSVNERGNAPLNAVSDKRADTTKNYVVKPKSESLFTTSNGTTKTDEIFARQSKTDRADIHSVLQQIAASSFDGKSANIFAEPSSFDKQIFDTPIDTSNDDFKRDKNSGSSRTLPSSENIKNDGNCDGNASTNGDVKILCSLFDTYLLLRQGEKYYLGDQHAIHERILYDSLVKSIQNEKVQSQPMLFSYTETLSAEESEKISRLLPELKRLGFEIALNGKEIEVIAIPAIMTNLKIKQFLHEIISSVKTQLSTTDFLFEKICQTACKAAIKAGYGFNENQLESLAAYINSHGLPTQCPHGRPAVIEITKSGLEKLFKRIV